MKKHIYTFLLCLICITALGQDAPPSNATAVSPNFTWYKKILLGDTSYYAYSSNNWVNLARRGWVQKSFMPVSDSLKYLKTSRNINISPYSFTAGRIIMAGSVSPDLGGASFSGLMLQSATADRFRTITAFTGSQKRWTYGVTGGGDESENGNNSGSNFAIGRYNDSGGLIDYPLNINRATGNINFPNTPTVNGIPVLVNPTGFVDVTTNQSNIAGNKTFTGHVSFGPTQFNSQANFSSNISITGAPGKSIFIYGDGGQTIRFEDNLNGSKDLQYNFTLGRLVFGPANYTNQIFAYLSDITSASTNYAKLTGGNTYLGNQVFSGGGLFGGGFTINGNGSAIFTALNASTLTTTGTIEAGNNLLVNGLLNLKGSNASLVILDRSDNTKEWQHFANSNQYVVFNQLLGGILTASYTTGVFNFSYTPTVSGVNIQTTTTSDSRYLQLTGGTLSNPLSINLNDIRTTSVNGVNLSNITAATSSIPLQYSPRIRLTGSAWNTTTLAPVTYNFDTQLRPATTNVNAANIYWSINNTDLLNLSQGGVLSALNGFSSYSSGANSAFFNLTGTGSLIQRNIADANPALTVNNILGTGDIFRVQQNGSNKFVIDGSGSASFSGNVSTGTRLSINSGSILSAALYLGSSSTLTTSGSFGVPGFGIRQDPLTYTSTAAGSTISLASANSFGIPTLANTNTTTLTSAATFYIGGAPVAGANTTIGTGYAVYLAGGVFYSGGTAIFNNTLFLNSTPTYASGNYTHLIKNNASGRLESINVLATNTTTVSLSASTLNSTYPNAQDGFQVLCNNITSGSAIYTKAGSLWLMTNCTVQQ